MKKNGKKRIGCILMLALMLVFTGCGADSHKEVKDTAGSTGKEAAEEQGNNREDEQETDGKETDAESYEELLEGDTAPDFTAQLADGSTFTLSEQKGKVVLLNFWATWCGPCVGEMPAFEKLNGEYEDKVSVLAVNCMEDTETVNQFISDNSYTFPIAYDVEGDVAMRYPSDGIPYTLVIDKEGVIRSIYVGAADAEAQYQEYKSAIESVLGQ